MIFYKLLHSLAWCLTNFSYHCMIFKLIKILSWLIPLFFSSPSLVIIVSTFSESNGFGPLHSGGTLKTEGCDIFSWMLPYPVKLMASSAHTIETTRCWWSLVNESTFVLIYSLKNSRSQMCIFFVYKMNNFVILHFLISRSDIEKLKGRTTMRKSKGTNSCQFGTRLTQFFFHS